ncbi:hypothetical protein B0I35DRAFT_450156 [Stachybotrys elegans]|uniref:Integral membrane protein n=1 Tax=Stachybotrys elegans TaxID=80388 RepID=A0A8K0SUV1_9HYPO|nr:hypothetical protein B0I35DRAFT_450156 [Stachybotrys elegans]
MANGIFHFMRTISLVSAASRLGLGLLLLPFVLADGGHDHHHNDAAKHDNDEAKYPSTYFALPDHAGLIYAHIALMTLAWVFVLPVAVMFSLARSRHTLLTQFVFLAINGLAVLLGTVYNAQTPDLYPGNAHHKIGWIITWVVSAQVLIGLVGVVSGVVRDRHSGRAAEEHSFIPMTEDSDGHHIFPDSCRFSNDSGQGTEPHTESVRSNSVSTTLSDEEGVYEPHKEYDDFEDMPLTSPVSKGFFVAKAVAFASTRVWRYVEICYQIIDRIILPFGFVALTTGIIAFCRFFEGHEIFSGLAHWIKGGVFFWLGLFNLGRWSGSFAELGWAWNARPRNSKWRPSAEFVESALIFFYGATNIFLEHLGNSGHAFSAQDLEHVSITVLFIGGGLSGMLIESTWIRDLLNVPVTMVVNDSNPHPDVEREMLQPPEVYQISINPIPALVIMLLGTMMSSHHQETMISSMIHQQWGNLLLGASVARGLTYMILYIKPPKSVLPSRPPTELLAAFGLIAGGIIFMASSSDTVAGMIHYDLDAMFLYTVTMGLVGLLMAWEVLVLALKGWAVRKECQRKAF